MIRETTITDAMRDLAAIFVEDFHIPTATPNGSVEKKVVVSVHCGRKGITKTFKVKATTYGYLVSEVKEEIWGR